MEEYRSKSCRDGRMQMESYYGGRPAPTSMHDLRSFSANYAGSSSSSSSNPPTFMPSKEVNMKKSKSRVGSASSKSWTFSDPELQRKKRVASYKAYTVEGKMKGSLKKSFRWIKDTCSQVVYGWW
ncbi:hypothetical protein BT93_F2541 [Corymbia citriodora subsp. variegata]|nr:hypothetical protein BT93_F2541 [Corymbia citriodora subsp. variegata]